MIDSAGKDYDQMVVAFDHLLSSLVKVEVLNDTQFRNLCERVKLAGFNADDERLVIAFLHAMRAD